MLPAIVPHQSAALTDMDKATQKSDEAEPNELARFLGQYHAPSHIQAVDKVEVELLR